MEGSGVVYDDYASMPQTQPQGGGPVTYVLARDLLQKRDDNSPRPQAQEFVAIGNGHQMAPVKKFKKSSKLPAQINTGWDFNLDGFKHIGLYPDLFQDIRNQGVSWEELTPLFNATEDYVQMWQRSCSIANQWRARNGLSQVQCQ
jgi:hypothetical protein